MDLWAIDYGGTETKTGLFRDGKLIESEVSKSKAHHLELLDDLEKRKPENSFELGLSLPGSVPFPFKRDSVWQYGLKPRTEDRKVRGEDLFRLFSEKIACPKIVVGDIVAGGFAQIENKTGVVAQLSTGIGMRFFFEGHLVLEKDQPALSQLSTNQTFKIGGEEKTFYNWLRKERREKWLPSNLRSWSEMKESDSPEVEKLVEIFSIFIKRGIDLGPFDTDNVFLIGGGASALEKRIMESLTSLELKPHPAPDPKTSGLKGINYLNQKDHIPVIQKNNLVIKKSNI